MAEEETKDVKNQETVKPEVTSEVESQEVSSKQSDKELNFAKLREKVEAESREKMELKRQVEELLKREEERNKPKPLPEEDELSTLTDDDIITVAQAKKLSLKQAEALINKKMAEAERAALPTRTRTQYNDFDAIMTTENIKKLEQEEPGLAQACAAAPNPWEATYKILKKFILPQQETQALKGDEKMKENLSKPVSSNTAGRQGPLNNANVWSEASRDDLYKEMMRCARGG